MALDERMDSRVTTAGQRHHSLAFDAVMAHIWIRRRGHGRPRPGRVLGDKAYSRPGAIRSHLRRRRIKTTIPEPADQQANRLRRGHNGGRPPKFESEIYKQRNTVERAINKLKGYRVGQRHRTHRGPVGAAGEGSPICHLQSIVNPSNYTRKRCKRSSQEASTTLTGLGDAFLGLFVAESGKAVKNGLLRLIGDPEQRAFERLVRDSVGPAVRRAAPHVEDQTALVDVIEIHRPKSFDIDIGDLLDPIEAVRRWLAPLREQRIGTATYFETIGLDGNILSEAIAAEILQRLMHQVRTEGPLRAIAEEVRWDRATRYLEHINTSVNALLDRVETARHMPGRPYMVPPKLGPVISRSELQDDILSLLFQGRYDGVAMSTALKGTGGFGKTTLAEEVCRSPRVVQHFSGGVLWATMGQDRGASHIAATLNSLSEEISGVRPVITDPARAGRHLESLLSDRPTLLVVDDVWTTMQAKAFSYGSSSTARLYTTRVASSVPKGASQVVVDAMEVNESREMLTLGLGPAEAEDVDPLLEMTGGWPVLLALVNGQAHHLVSMGNSTSESLQAIAWQIRQLGPAALDLTHSNQREDAVAATVEASLSFLGDQRSRSLERYLMMSVFPAGFDIPISLLAAYWKLSDTESAHQLCIELYDLSLIQRYRLARDVRLHDVVHSYLRSRVGQSQLAIWSESLLRAHMVTDE